MNQIDWTRLSDDLHNAAAKAAGRDYLLSVRLLLLALVSGATLREAWRFARDPDDWAAACGIALLAVVAGTLVRNMTDTLLVRQTALLYWGGIVGVLLGLGRSWGQR